MTEQREKPVKLEVNVPVWLEFVPHPEYGFSPYEKDNEAKEITLEGGKKKKIPAHKSWMFGVIPPKKPQTVMFINHEAAKDAISDMAQQEEAAGRPARIAVMQLMDNKKYFLCLFAHSTGYKVLPAHDVPERFKEVCGAAPAPVASPAKPAPAAPPPQTNGAHRQLDWNTATEAMVQALQAARDAWDVILTDAANVVITAEESQNQADLTRAIEFYGVAKNAAANGLPKTAHTLFIEVMRGGRSR